MKRLFCSDISQLLINRFSAVIILQYTWIYVSNIKMIIIYRL